MFRTAAFSTESKDPPRLMLTTAWLFVLPILEATQFRPLTTSEVLPDPSQSRTRTGTIVAKFATPYVVPAADDAT